MYLSRIIIFKTFLEFYNYTIFRKVARRRSVPIVIVNEPRRHSYSSRSINLRGEQSDVYYASPVTRREHVKRVNLFKIKCCIGKKEIIIMCVNQF